MKRILVIFSVLALIIVGGAVAWVMVEQAAEPKTYSWRYKMTVSVETPEGIKTGSAVREMGNDTRTDFPTNGNPAQVRGEAVVVDLGERGTLFALIDSDSDMEFYGTFREPNGFGGSTPEGIKYYASLPVGTKASLGTDRYLRLVTFTDMNDPKSVALVYDTEICWFVRKTEPKCRDGQKMYTKADRFEELLGEGVRLKDVTLEITDEPVTIGIVDGFLPEIFWGIHRKWMKSMNIGERGRTLSFGKSLFVYGDN